MEVSVRLLVPVTLPPRERVPGTLGTEGWLDPSPRDPVQTLWKKFSCPCQESILDSLAAQPLARRYTY
jgi:hypothetical protein